MFHRLFILTFLCYVKLIWTISYCPEDCNEKVYVVGNAPTLWFEANILCRQAGMELASIESYEEQKSLEKNIKEVHNPRKHITNGYWSSGVRRKSSPQEMVWFVNGRPLTFSKFSFGQPDNNKNNEACIEIFIDDREGILWNDYICDQKIGYICQKFVRNLTCETISKSTCSDDNLFMYNRNL